MLLADDFARANAEAVAFVRTFSTADLAPVAARHTREHLGHAQCAAVDPD